MLKLNNNKNKKDEEHTMEIFDISIIGAGASGLFCANNLDNKFKVALIEKEPRVGKKILATGNGKCNLTNINMSSNFFNQNVDNFLKKFNAEQTLKSFHDLGLLAYADEEKRVYPVSNSANSVLDVLRLPLEHNDNVELFLESKVESINKEKDYYKLVLQNGEKIYSKKIVLATGNYDEKILKSLDEKIIPFKKSLCALKTKTPNKGLNGIRVDNVCAKLEIENNFFVEFGEILFKDNSISGILIFNLSAYMARVGNYNQKIVLDLLPTINNDEIEEMLNNRKKYLNNEHFLTGIFHSALAKNILEKCNFDTKNIKNIVNIIKNYEIYTTEPMDNNQVLSGGVDLLSLDDNLQSRKLDNIFYIGECVDVDGICGGYNLQWAWTSAKIVAEFLNKGVK